MAESTLQKIARKTGRKVSFCKCNECKKQCTTPCLGTPEDIEKIIDAGLKPTEGKLSHHSTRIDNFKASKSISWQIAKEWIDPKNNATIQRIKEKLNV